MRGGKIIAGLFTAVLSVSSAQDSAALIFGPDNRPVVDTRAGSPLSPVGIVFNPGERCATAFLVDDCHVLTVQHVFGERATAEGRSAVFAVRIGANSWLASWGVVEHDGGLEATPGVRVNDWALIRLQKCLGKIQGHVSLSSRLPAVGESIGSVGYPADQPVSGQAVADPSCKLRRVYSLSLLHDCASLPGSSGSPMFRMVQERGRPMLEVFAMADGPFVSQYGAQRGGGSRQLPRLHLERSHGDLQQPPASRVGPKMSRRCPKAHRLCNVGFGLQNRSSQRAKRSGGPVPLPPTNSPILLI